LATAQGLSDLGYPRAEALLNNLRWPFALSRLVAIGGSS
jgi:hypothetical protein